MTDIQRSQIRELRIVLPDQKGNGNIEASDVNLSGITFESVPILEKNTVVARIRSRVYPRYFEKFTSWMFGVLAQNMIYEIFDSISHENAEVIKEGNFLFCNCVFPLNDTGNLESVKFTFQDRNLIRFEHHRTSFEEVTLEFVSGENINSEVPDLTLELSFKTGDPETLAQTKEELRNYAKAQLPIFPKNFMDICARVSDTLS